MCFFEWDSSLDVNVEEMNDQHRKLIDKMEILYQKNLKGVPKEELIASADDLMTYCAKHFRDEEAYMASMNFAGLESHKKLHVNLMTDLKRYVDDFRNGDTDQVGDEFVTFLKMWLSTHIRGIDTKYGYGL
jgi:hemerythrin